MVGQTMDPSKLSTDFAMFFRAHRLYYSFGVGGLAFLLQLLLFYAIVYKSPAQFRVFKNLVLLDNCLACLFNLGCVILQPVSLESYSLALETNEMKFDVSFQKFNPVFLLIYAF
jgi:hypothetical protein